jgi:hypothetical protein
MEAVYSSENLVSLYHIIFRIRSSHGKNLTLHAEEPSASVKDGLFDFASQDGVICTPYTEQTVFISAPYSCNICDSPVERVWVIGRKARRKETTRKTKT